MLHLFVIKSANFIVFIARGDFLKLLKLKKASKLTYYVFSYIINLTGSLLFIKL